MWINWIWRCQHQSLITHANWKVKSSMQQSVTFWTNFNSNWLTHRIITFFWELPKWPWNHHKLTFFKNDQKSLQLTIHLCQGGKLNELMSLTEFSLSHSYQSKLSKTGSSLDFPSLLFPVHAQYTLCTCSVKGFPSLLCLHMLSLGASLNTNA